MADALYKPGDLLSVAKWDRSERPQNKLGDPVEVIGVHQVANCESGWMVSFRTKGGAVRCFDQNWFTPYMQDSPKP